MTERIDIKTGRGKLGELVDRAAQGEQIIFTKRGRDMALLVALDHNPTIEYLDYIQKIHDNEPGTGAKRKRLVPEHESRPLADFEVSDTPPNPYTVIDGPASAKAKQAARDALLNASRKK